MIRRPPRSTLFPYTTSSDLMFIATSVGGNSSGASVFFSRDGEDLVFFTFHPTRKAEQIRLNPRVHVVIWPKGQEGIEGLQIDGECYKIKDEQDRKSTRPELQSHHDLVCRLLLEKKKKTNQHKQKKKKHL